MGDLLALMMVWYGLAAWSEEKQQVGVLKF